jgi:hypothetical protein
MDDFEAGKVEGRNWMTQVLKTHDEFEARALSEEEKFRRGTAQGGRLSRFDDGFFVAAEAVLVEDVGR